MKAKVLKKKFLTVDNGWFDQWPEPGGKYLGSPRNLDGRNSGTRTRKKKNICQVYSSS